MYVVQLGHDEYTMHGPFETVAQAAAYGEAAARSDTYGQYGAAITILPLIRANPVRADIMHNKVGK